MLERTLPLVLAAAALAAEGDPATYVDPHGSRPAQGSEPAAQAPPPADDDAVGAIPAGANPNVDGLRGDRRTRSIGYVEWVPRADVMGFLLEWGTSPGGPYWSVADQPMQGRELLLRGMPAGEMVFVRIRAVFPNGAQGPWTAPLAIPPIGD